MARGEDSASHKSDRELLEELAGRARRTENKVTILSNHMGVDITQTKPVYDKEKRTVWVKTAKTSLEDILEAMGDNVVVAQVFCGERFLATVCPA